MTFVAELNEEISDTAYIVRDDSCYTDDDSETQSLLYQLSPRSHFITNTSLLINRGLIISLFLM